MLSADQGKSFLMDIDHKFDG
jgi:ActR/RegA family two-component response regulator